MPLSMDRQEGLPLRCTLPMLHPRIKHPVVIDLVRDPTDLEFMTAKQTAAYYRMQAQELVRFLMDYLDPMIVDTMIEYFMSMDGYQPPEAMAQEVPLRFRISDPAHPHYDQEGEMLYVEGENGPFYLWIGGKAVRVEQSQITKVGGL